MHRFALVCVTCDMLAFDGIDFIVHWTLDCIVGALGGCDPVLLVVTIELLTMQSLWVIGAFWG